MANEQTSGMTLLGFKIIIDDHGLTKERVEYQFRFPPKFLKWKWLSRLYESNWRNWKTEYRETGKVIQIGGDTLIMSRSVYQALLKQQETMKSMSISMQKFLIDTHGTRMQRQYRDFVDEMNGRIGFPRIG